MKSTLLILSLLLLSPFAPRTQAQTAGPTTTENYYKTLPGHQQDFLQLFMKNHYPILAKELADGRIVSFKMETPTAYMPEDVRWDYRVTIVSKAPSGSNADYEAKLKLQLWPDQDTFKREEKQRFDNVLAHWDITVTAVTPPAK